MLRRKEIADIRKAVYQCDSIFSLLALKIKNKQTGDKELKSSVDSVLNDLRSINQKIENVFDDLDNHIGEAQ